MFVREFVWQKTLPLLSWRTLIRTPEDGGLNLVHAESCANAFIIQHLYKFMSLVSIADQSTNLSLPRWFFFTRYWIGLQLSKYMPQLRVNGISHAEHRPCTISVE